MGRGWVGAEREADCLMVIAFSCFVTSECLLLVAIDVRLMSCLLMHNIQHANRVNKKSIALCLQYDLDDLRPEVAQLCQFLPY